MDTGLLDPWEYPENELLCSVHIWKNKNTGNISICYGETLDCHETYLTEREYELFMNYLKNII